MVTIGSQWEGGRLVHRILSFFMIRDKLYGKIGGIGNASSLWRETDVVVPSEEGVEVTMTMTTSSSAWAEV